MYSRENLSDLLEKAHYTSVNVADKRVILRSCLNVTVDGDGTIIDDTRLKEALPVIRDLAVHAKKLIILGHMGRPTPRRLTHYKTLTLSSEEKKLTFAKIGNYIEKSLGDLTRDGNPFTVRVISDSETAYDHAKSMHASEIILMENIRFSIGEEAKDEASREIFADELATIGDIYVNDAFPDYREAASTYTLAKKLPSYLGTSFYNEVKALSSFTQPQRPFVAVLGGAKLSEKLEAMNSLLQIADTVIVGGAMAYTVLKAKGIPIGNSLFEEDKLELALEMSTNYPDKLQLPVDHKVVKTFDAKSAAENTDSESIQDEMIAIDIGPETIKKYSEVLQSAKSILLNGPMGVFEWESGEAGTRAVMNAISENSLAFRLAGGGDSINAIHKFGVSGFNHVSTGGGALLAFLAYDRFPTLDIILDKFV